MSEDKISIGIPRTNGSLTIAQPIDIQIFTLDRNGNKIDVTEFGILSGGSFDRDPSHDLLFYAYKELISLRQRVKELEDNKDEWRIRFITK